MTIMRCSFRMAGVVIGWLATPLFVMFARKDRVRVMVVRKNGDVLLVRPYIGRQNWALPGGGVKRGESYEQAAVREVHEEVDIAIDPELRYLGRVLSHESFYPFPVRVYRAMAMNERIRCNGEIIEAQWLPVRELSGEYRAML
ncbi:MAG: NUDIX hydrolase [Candidatus Saccharibacteria bacterium]|nr:NUDIX hydrolase [Candidatus Saccharibacteria bacterium]